MSGGYHGYYSQTNTHNNMHKGRQRYFDSDKEDLGPTSNREDRFFNDSNGPLGKSHGFTASERYGINDGKKFESDRGRKQNIFKRRETHRVPTFENAEDTTEQSSSRPKRHPPGLRGREIGLWYAQRHIGQKEKERKNRPTVSMDKTRENSIRELLSNLKQDVSHQKNVTGSKNETASNILASSSSSKSWTSDLASFPSQFSQSSQHIVKDEEYKEEVKEEPPDSWEDGDFDEMETEVEKPGSRSQEEPVDLDGYDDEDNQLPSVTGVVEYMKSHGDYPYAGEEPESDFMAINTDSLNPEYDMRMKLSMERLCENPQYVKMVEFRKKLPSYQMRETIVGTINSNQVLVVSGETGCGKTTQVPQFILDDFIQRGIGSQCRIICTQPRRISAISVSERVAAERCEKVDKSYTSSVGYQIRLETKLPRSHGSILFCTTGIVLKFLEKDPCLKRATHVIIDEIHERDLQSDFLMIILKDLLPLRPDLKVILMSATLNAEMFSEYFNKCPMLSIPGFTFPVKEYLLEDVIEMTGYTSEDISPRRRQWRKLKPGEREEQDNYAVWCRNLQGRYSQKTISVLQNFDFSKVNIDLMAHIVNYICTRLENGAILVFVPGWEDIKKLNEAIQNTPRCKSGSLKVIPLHSLMPTVNQREVFERPPPGVRKIVIATNIAETSITIDDVVFVIDCGKIKVKGFQPEINLSSLETQWVSKANAKQRRGRAGRVQPGYCFHLYTEFQYSLAPDYLPPEMLRTRLEELCLQIKLLKLGYIVPFISKAMQHPSKEAITHAVETLMELNALDANENLLPLGYHLARMPVEPHTGKMILFAAMFCCLDPILTVAASLSFKDAFTIPLGKEHLADQTRIRLSGDSKSDHIMLINAFKGWEDSLRRGTSQRYCWENFLSDNTLKMLRDMKKQLAELLYDIGFIDSKDPKNLSANKNSDNQGLVKAVLCAGLYPNVAEITKVPTAKSSKYRGAGGLGMLVKDNTKIQAHPKSVNMKQTFFESKWMVFYHKLKTTKVYIHDCTMVSPYPLLFFGGEIKILKEGGMDLVSVDDWVKFKASASTAQLVKDLRQQLDKLLTKKITDPGPTCWDQTTSEGALMAAIADLITMEEKGYTVRGQSMGGSIGKKETGSSSKV
ncbi:unnamed protein product [Lymnaea stagnalis]|uniref:RNA helicase n=1 Tax=Lymnaea stagnalis TaxID=6523 RepID=A0AAV2H6P0_LYMST